MDQNPERHYRIIVELVFCRHFPQIRGGGVEGIGVVPGADYRAWFVGDKIDITAAKPLAEAFVAQHGDDLRAGAIIFHPGTIRGIMSTMLILETAGIPAEQWENQMVCQPGLYTYHPAEHCYPDGRGYTMAEFFADRPDFSKYEGGRFYGLMEALAVQTAHRKNFNAPVIKAFAIAHGEPLDLGFAEALFRQQRFTSDSDSNRDQIYREMKDIGKGEIQKISFRVIDVNRPDNFPGDVPVDLIRVNG